MSLGGVDRNMCGAFLLWKGAPMMDEEVAPYEKYVGSSFVNLPENTSCSRDMKMAVAFALDFPKPHHSPVLFIISVRNYQPPTGIMMSNEAYSAYPSEQQFILTEGKEVWVLAVERNVKIDNT